MSSFFAKFENIHTGKVVDVFCYDDYYGPHEYGYQISGDNVVFTEAAFNNNFKRYIKGENT